MDRFNKKKLLRRIYLSMAKDLSQEGSLLTSLRMTSCSWTRQDPSLRSRQQDHFAQGDKTLGVGLYSLTCTNMGNKSIVSYLVIRGTNREKTPFERSHLWLIFVYCQFIHTSIFFAEIYSFSCCLPTNSISACGNCAPKRGCYSTFPSRFVCIAPRHGFSSNLYPTP